LLELKSPELTTNLNPNAASTPESGDPPLSRLLNLFPAARRMHLAITVDLPLRLKGVSEKTTILFGTPDTAIFLLKFPVTGGTTLALRPNAEPLSSKAVVFALMPYGRGLAIAALFQETPKWFDAERAKQDPRTASHSNIK
jgi:hypothetical protein